MGKKIESFFIWKYNTLQKRVAKGNLKYCKHYTISSKLYVLLWCDFYFLIHTAGYLCPPRSKSQIPKTQKEAGLFHKDTTEREIATRIKHVLWKSGAAGRYYR